MTQYGGEFLFPPRPDNAVGASSLKFYEEKNWVVQCKKNGTCSVIHVRDGRIANAWTRHGEAHKMWSPNPEAEVGFSHLKGDWVFVAELLHSKVKGMRNILYVFDCLVANGRYCYGDELQFRLNVLSSELKGDLPREERKASHRVVTPNLWVANSYWGGNALELFNEFNGPDDEGIVMKDPHAKLKRCYKNGPNNKSMVKHRRPTKNYGN